MWLGLIDFEKAFDTVDHRKLWETLATHGVEARYISLLQKLYRSQTASVWAGHESHHFSIERGVKQGDPISASIFG